MDGRNEQTNEQMNKRRNEERKEQRSSEEDSFSEMLRTGKGKRKRDGKLKLQYGYAGEILFLRNELL